MIRHIVMWKFRPGTEAEQAQFLNGLRNLQGVIPQLLRSEVSVNTGDGNYDAVLVSEFRDLEALRAYREDPGTRRCPLCADPSAPTGHLWITNVER